MSAENVPGATASPLPLVAIPAREDAIELAWDSAMAKSRGIYGFDSMDPRSRSFNLIRAKILEMYSDLGWRMFGVVSATPNVGKSFVCANIAAAISRDPRFATYAVDLDLRRGSLSGIFGIEPETSLRDYLEDRPGVDVPAFYTLENERLMIAPTVAGQIHSAELLAGPRAQTLLRSMRMAKDDSLYFFDLPPVFANDDAATTMARLDAYVLVAEEGKTKLREIEDAVEMLGTGRCAGVILNKFRGGLVSEGYGVDDYYAAGYSKDGASPEG